jgi:hypothetical protein
MIKKHILVFAIIASCMLPTSSFSQVQKAESVEKAEPATKLEQFLSKRGRLYVKDFYKAGTVSGQYGQWITVDALIVYEPGKEIEKNRGLKIEVYEGGRLEKSHSSFLDLEEVESLSKAIDYMINMINKFKDTSREYTEVIFSTRGGFKIGFYQTGDKFQAFAESGTIGNAHCFIPAESLSNLKSVIDKGLVLAKK